VTGYHLTGSSLQSADEVQKVAGALGIDDKDLRKRVEALKPLFVARNEISHELDLQSPEKADDRTRRSRGMGKTVTICNMGFDAVSELSTPSARSSEMGRAGLEPATDGL
jgi:hypothetical protein